MIKIWDTELKKKKKLKYDSMCAKYIYECIFKSRVICKSAPLLFPNDYYRIYFFHFHYRFKNSNSSVLKNIFEKWYFKIWFTISF